MIQLRGPLTLPAPVELEPPGPAESSRLEVDLDAIEHNVGVLTSLMSGDRGYDPATLRQVRRDQRRRRPAAGKPRVCGVVKKDAYGLGATAIAHRLMAAGCSMLAVYNVEEAEGLIRAGVRAPILLFAPLRQLTRTDALYRHAVAGLLELTIHDLQQLEQVQQIGLTFGIKVPVHFMLDTGMSRGGLNEAQLAAALGRLADCKQVALKGLYSHCATAPSNGDFAYEQLDRLEAAVADHADRLPADCAIHLGATHATLRDQCFHLDMIRPGLGLYGYGQEDMTGPVIADAPAFKHCLRWTSRLIHAQRYPRSSPVGYDSTHKLRREAVVGLVPVGYGDGYAWSLSNKAVVRVATRAGAWCECRVLGRVSMDQITVDLTEAIAADREQTGSDRELPSWVGAEVELVSTDPAAGNALPKLAAAAKSTSYEMLCRLGAHLPKRYLTTR
ncbi:MAG: alanine racemase [Planctomycetota bacterium]